MRKPLAVVTAALIVLGGNQLPAHAAAPAAPTDVQISWADVAKGTVRITWKDNGEANFIGQESDGLPTDPPSWIAKQDAGGNNELILTNVRTGWHKLRLTVRSWANGAESPRTPTAWFDSQLPAAPVLTGGAPLADLSLRVTWSQALVEDITPNDPLDRPASDETLTATVTPNNGGPVEKFPLALGTKATTIPPRPRPYPVRLTAANEWGTATPVASITFGTMTVGLRIDPLATYQKSVHFDVVNGAKSCLTCGYDSGRGITSYLQSRADASQPWKTVAFYGGQGAQFSAFVTTYGGRQYRIYVPAWTEISTDRSIVTPAASTSARFSATQAAFRVAGFNTLTAQVGQVVKTTVDVLPAGTVKSSLQWYDGKVWRHSVYIPLTKGKGTFSFKAAGRGTTRYWRVVVPKMTMNGLPIVATPSKAFKLTVR